MFARFLAGVEATPYVVTSYARLLPSANVSAAAAERRVERALLAVARTSVPAVHIADSYARFFLPRSLLRRRLVLLLAVMENSPLTERPLNTAYVASPASIVWRLGMIGMGSVASLAIGVLVFAPVHLLSGSATETVPVSRH